MVRVQRLIGIAVVAVLVVVAFMAGMVASPADSAFPANAAARHGVAQMPGGSTPTAQDEPSDEMAKFCEEHMAEMQPEMERMMNNMMSDMMRETMR